MPVDAVGAVAYAYQARAADVPSIQPRPTAETTELERNVDYRRIANARMDASREQVRTWMNWQGMGNRIDITA